MSAQSIGQIFGGYGQRKGKGNAAAPGDPVRSHSIDVGDPRARPGRQIGDGTSREGWAFKNAQLKTLGGLYECQRKKGYDGKYRVQATHLHIYKVMLDQFLFIKNGDFFPSYKAIAEKSGESEATIKRMVLVLEYHGFLCHVRRSRKVDERDGEPGWERVTASNAYYFDCEARMCKSLWETFWGFLVANMKSIRKIAARAAQGIKQAFNSVAKPAPRATNTELHMTLSRVEEAITRRDAAAAAGGSAVVRPTRPSSLARVQT